MTAKEYFEQALTLDKRIGSKLDHLSSLREMVTKASTTLSDMPKSSSRNMHRLEDIICKIVDLEDEINDDIDHFVDMKREYMQVIGSITSPVHQLIMEKRYLCCQTWEQISLELGYDMRWLLRLHGRALIEVEKALQTKLTT